MKTVRRLPFVTFDEANKLVSIQDKVKAPIFHLLLFSGSESDEKLNSVRTFLTEYNEVIRIEPIPLTQATKDLYGVLGVKKDGYYLVRPDMYIAYRSNGFSEEHVKKFLMTSIHFKHRN